MLFRCLTCLTPLVLAACASSPIPSPLGDPRDDGPFIATSDFPHLPHVARMTNSEGCQGEPLRARAAPMPEYPARGWSRGLQGWSIVQFDVLPSGAVDEIRIANGVPGGSFDKEARKAMENWAFHPLQGEEPLRGCVVLFEFRMGEVRLR